MVWKRLKSSALLRNSSWMMAGQGFSILVQALYFVVLARLLGAAEYGLLAGATALIATGSTYSSLGSGFVFIRQVSPDHSRFHIYWGYLLVTTLIGGALVVVLITLIAHWLIRDLSILAVLCLALGDSLFLQITAGAGRVFQTFEIMHFSAMSSLIVNVLRLVTAFFLLLFWHHATVTNWAVVSVLVSMVGSAIAVSIVTARLGRPSWSFALTRKHAFEGLMFSSTISTSSVYNDVDKVLMGHYGMNVANGIYAMAYKAIDTSFMVVRSIHSAAFPRFCREGAVSLAAVRGFAARLLGKTFLVSVILSIALFLAAPLIPLFAGKAFGESTVALRFLCLIPVLRCCHLAAGDALSGAGLQRYRFSCELCAAVFNLALNLYLIPLYSWRGAAFASLMTDGGLAITSWVLLKSLVSREARQSAVTLAA